MVKERFVFGWDMTNDEVADRILEICKEHGIHLKGSRPKKQV